MVGREFGGQAVLDEMSAVDIVAAIRDNNPVVEHGVLGIVVVRQREFDWGSTVC